MPSKRASGLIEAFKQMPNDSSTKTLLVALGVSFVCALVVSTAAVLLRPIQVANQERAQQEQILGIASRIPEIQELMGEMEEPEIESQMIELSTGKIVPDMNAAEYDMQEAADDPQRSILLPPGEDLAGIQRRPTFAPVHLVKQEDRTRLYILPIYGSGYQSTLYGYLALEEDVNTVAALTFYEHGETPGIGGRIDTPEWRNQWQGKKVWDEEGNLRLDVASGQVSPSNPEARFLVDGITGATRTTRGVANLVRFWLGENGYGPYLERLRSQQSADTGIAS